MVKENNEKITPMMKQYLSVKERYKDAFLFFRVGDFYELFFDDAVKAASILNIALTSRDKSEQDAVPLCGVPHHAVDAYIKKMIQEGHKVVLCDQIEDPRYAKGIVKRDVVRVITPGTLTDIDALDPKNNNYIASIYFVGNEYGIAFADISCGEFECFRTDDPVRDVFERINPKEIVVLSSQKDIFLKMTEGVSPHKSVSVVDDTGFDLTGSPEMISGVFLRHYINSVVMLKDISLDKPKPVQINESLFIDENGRRDLEIFEPVLKGTRNSSLLDVMDDAVTSMGSRKIRYFLAFPLTAAGHLEERWSMVGAFVMGSHTVEKLRGSLKKIFDMERLAGNIMSSSPCPRHIMNLKESLFCIPEIKEDVAKIQGKPFEFELDELEPVKRLIGDMIVDEPPLNLREGGIIRKGFSPELDELRDIVKGGTGFLHEYEKKERQRTGITSLKVGYNRVFGYYIEITKTNLKNAPPEYIRKQTLVNAERFITEELKHYEDKILSASEKIKELEIHLFKEFIEKLKQFMPGILKLADEIALIDVFSTFAHNAIRYNYTRPALTDGNSLHIEGGRHPFVERSVKLFVPNDIVLNGDEGNIMLITGPNMAGKSTYMRQVALIVIMAQAGSFVPASSARLPVFTQIFTRIGTSDYLASGKSTFMVEMLETAKILKESDEKSLVLLDEVGRGTSTYDGMAIAWSVLEFLADKKQRPCVLFSTHYHELTELALTKKNISNYNVIVREWKDEIIFLHKVQKGVANKSYGIHVAKLAELPASVVTKAQEILVKLEKGDLFGKREKIAEDKNAQLSLFSSIESKVIKELRDIKLEVMTPLDAFELLKRIREFLKK